MAFVCLDQFHFSMIPSRSIHSVADEKSSSLCVAESYPTVYTTSAVSARLSASTSVASMSGLL